MLQNLNIENQIANNKIMQQNIKKDKMLVSSLIGDSEIIQQKLDQITSEQLKDMTDEQICAIYTKQAERNIALNFKHISPNSLMKLKRDVLILLKHYDDFDESVDNATDKYLEDSKKYNEEYQDIVNALKNNSSSVKEMLNNVIYDKESKDYEIEQAKTMLMAATDVETLEPLFNKINNFLEGPKGYEKGKKTLTDKFLKHSNTTVEAALLLVKSSITKETVCKSLVWLRSYTDNKINERYANIVGDPNMKISTNTSAFIFYIACKVAIDESYNNSYARSFMSYFLSCCITLSSDKEISEFDTVKFRESLDKLINFVYEIDFKF